MSGDQIDRFDDTAEVYRNIFSSISQDLKHYEEDVGKFTEEEARKIDLYAETLFDKVIDKVHQYNKNSYSMFKSCEDVESWFQRVKSLQDTTFKEDVKGEGNWGNFLFKHAQSSRQLQQLETEVLAKLRQLVNEEESPEYVRLKLMKEDMSSRLQIRNSVASQIENEINNATVQLNNTVQSRDVLVRDMERAEQTLKIFTAKNSFQIVQDARKKEIIENGWIRRNIELADQIETIRKEVEQFHNPEKFESEMKKISLQQDSEYKKLNSQYEDELFLINHELGQISSTHQAMMEQLKKELNEIRSEQLKQERKLTTNAVKQEKMACDRFINNYKKVRFASIKSIEKEFKRTAIQLNDLIQIITDDHQKDIEEMKSNISKMFSELQEILNRRQSSIGSLNGFQINQIKTSNQILLSALESNKEQIIEKSIHKDIEIDALNRQIVPVEGVYNDLYQIYSALLDQQNNIQSQFKAESDKLDGIRKISDMRNKARIHFIERAKQMIQYLKSLLRERMKKSNPIKKNITEIEKNRPKDDMDLVIPKKMILPETKIKSKTPNKNFEKSEVKTRELVLSDNDTEEEDEPFLIESPYKSDESKSYSEKSTPTSSKIYSLIEEPSEIQENTASDHFTLEEESKQEFLSSNHEFEIKEPETSVSREVNSSIDQISNNNLDEKSSISSYSSIQKLSSSSSAVSSQKSLKLINEELNSYIPQASESYQSSSIQNSELSWGKDLKPTEPKSKPLIRSRSMKNHQISPPIEETPRRRAYSGVQKIPAKKKTRKSSIIIQKNNEFTRPTLLLPKTDVILSVKPISGQSSYTDSLELNTSEREPKLRRKSASETDKSYRYILRGSTFGTEPKKKRASSKVKIRKK